MTINARRARDHKYLGRIVVTLDGRDVTGSCYYLDTRRGVVRLMLRDLAGAPVLNPVGDDVIRYERRGHVVVRLRS